MLLPELAGASALRTGFSRRAGGGARALARLARLFSRNDDRCFGAFRGLVEGDLEIVAEVGASLRPAAAPPAAAEDLAEAEHVTETGEDVRKVREDRGVESWARARAGDTRMAEAIVQAALLRVGQDGVRLRRFLEGLLGLVISGVAIGMEFQRELAIRALDLDFARVPGHTKDFIVITLAHAAQPFATFTIDGRRRRSPSV